MSFIRNAVTKLILPGFERDLTGALQREFNVLAKLCEPAKPLTATFGRRTAVEQIQKTPRRLITDVPHVPGRLGLGLVVNRVPTYCPSSGLVAMKCL